MNRRLVAYLMLSVTLAAAVFCYALLRGMSSNHIEGASSQRQYYTLGISMPHRVNYIIGSKVLSQLAMHLPLTMAVASGFTLSPKFASLTLSAGPEQVRVAMNLIGGPDYFKAVGLSDVLGRPLDPVAIRDKHPVMMLNRPAADALFGSAQAALGKSVVLHFANEKPKIMQVRGVVTSDFAGLSAHARYWAAAPVAWMPSPFPGGITTLLSVRAGMPVREIQHDLDLAWQALPMAARGDGSRGLVFSEPYTSQPVAVAAAIHKLKLYFVVAIAASLLALINLLALNFLEARRRRMTYFIERTLGATRAWQFRQVVFRSLLGASIALLVGCGLIVGSTVWTKAYLISAASKAVVIGLSSPLWRMVRDLCWPEMLALVAVLIALVAVAEMLVQGVLVIREMARDGSAAETSRASGSRGERQLGGGILALEFALAALLAVSAGWGAHYAWRMTQRHLGMLQGQPDTLVYMKGNNTYISKHPHVFARVVPNGLLTADLQRAVAAISPHTKAGFGPILGLPYRHGAGNFRGLGDGKLEAGHAATLAVGFTASPSWLPAAEVQLLSGRNFSREHPDPHGILIDAEVAKALFGSTSAAIGRSVQWHWEGGGPLTSLNVQGVIAPLRLKGPGHAAVASFVAPLPTMRKSFMDGQGGAIVIHPTIPVARDPVLRDAIERVFAKDAPYLEVGSIQSSAQVLNRLDRPQRILATVFGAVAGFALLIALTGLAVFLRLFLVMRKRVDAIQSALGSSPRRQYTRVLLGTLALGVAGAVLALLFTPWLAQQFALLSGAQVSPFGWATWIALGVLLLAVFLVAHFPARRAARAEPAESLHEL